ncbi:MAG: UdgX family uracil-DNA binding protein, partial [Brevundimonas sp.]
MHSVTLEHETDFDSWRDGARRLRLAGVPPHEAVFHVGAGNRGLFDEALPCPDPASTPVSPGFAVPRAFVDVARDVVLHRSPDRFTLLYRLLWRLDKEPDLMK